MKKSKLLVFVAMVVSLLMLSCFMLACVKPEAVTVTISQATLTLKEGATKQLTATASDESAITWSSSDDTKVTVSATGLVKGIKEGTATITAASGDAKATCVVTIEKAALRITLSLSEKEIEVGDEVTITAETTDGSAVTWESSDTSIATVVGGKVTGVAYGEATITAKTGAVSETCFISVIPKGAVVTDIEFGGEADSLLAPNAFMYWSDQPGWNGSDVTVTKSRMVGDIAEFSYTAIGNFWAGMQVFYHNSANEVGKYYKVSLKIHSSVAADVTINGTVVTLKVGNNDIEVFYKEARGSNWEGKEDGSSFRLSMGVEAEGVLVPEATIRISDLSFTEFTPEKLAAPSAIAIADKVVTITCADEDKSAGFKLYFYQDDALKLSITVANGDEINDSTMRDGTYTVKAQALGKGARADSDISTASTTYVVENGGIVYDLEYATEDDAIQTVNKFFYWTENASVTADYDIDTLTVEFENNVGNWYNVQLFYKNSSFATNDKFTLSFNLNSTAAGHITINGVKTEIKVGDNAILIDATQGAKSTITIIMGVYGEPGVIEIEAATMVFTDIAMCAPVDLDVLTKSDDAGSVANPGELVYWYSEAMEWGGSVVTVSKAELKDGVAEFSYATTAGKSTYGFQLFYTNADNVVGNRYVVTLKINSSVAGDITVNGQKISIVAGDNLIKVAYTEARGQDWKQETNGASLSIQMGVKADDTTIANATIKVSDIAFASL